MTTSSGITEKEVPGPRGHPVIGSLLDLVKDPLAFVSETTKTYGDLAAVNVGPVRLYLASNPHHIKHMMQDNRYNYTKGTMWNTLRRIFSNGLLASEGDFWLRQRRLMQPAFHRQRLAALTTLMTDAVTQMLDRWEPFAENNQTISISEEMIKVALQLLLKTLFSRGVTEDEIHTLASSFEQALKLVNRRLWLFFLPERLPLPGDQRFRDAIGAIDRIIYRLIEERRQSTEEIDDLLSMLLEARDEETGETMDDKQLRDEIFNLFLAGHETMALTITWTWYLLHQHPEVMRKVQQEVDNALGDRRPTFEDLPKLKYTLSVIEETMRLYPVAWIIPRAIQETELIDGYRLKPGSTVLICTYTLHRNPEFWENPDQFIPERFLAERTVDRFAYMPFGAGPRLCIGNNFALMEMQLMVALTMQRYHLNMVNAATIQPKILTTLQPDQPLKVIVQKRTVSV
jgi:cytochrome P450